MKQATILVCSKRSLEHQIMSILSTVWGLSWGLFLGLHGGPGCVGVDTIPQNLSHNNRANIIPLRSHLGASFECGFDRLLSKYECLGAHRQSGCRRPALILERPRIDHGEGPGGGTAPGRREVYASPWAQKATHLHRRGPGRSSAKPVHMAKYCLQVSVWLQRGLAFQPTPKRMLTSRPPPHGC
jgi:hypothetical protein